MTSNNSYEYIDKASIGESLLCELCHDPFINPVVTQCGYTYCGACIEPKIRSGSQCPSRSCNQLMTTAHLKSNTSMSLTISILDNLKQKTQLEQQTTQLDQQKTKLEQQKTELGQQKIQLGQQKTKLEQQTTVLGQQKTEIELQKIKFEQQKAQLQWHEIKIDVIQSENQTQRNEAASIRKQITILQKEISKLKSAALWLCK
ncbi:unnamed protein product [Rotaria magnacalcarata]|uniref:RING-type domain-containing protein n=1 Tax=Rotaria magnacalcarata TaxID=392030 RepID=A0A815K7T3_9BILA|nr:unnamed protein product [Rotaria magnacalcarata]